VLLEHLDEGFLVLVQPGHIVCHYFAVVGIAKPSRKALVLGFGEDAATFHTPGHVFSSTEQIVGRQNSQICSDSRICVSIPQP
jgi:hypothetical protein